jgi:pantoate--beta-alanine ligase
VQYRLGRPGIPTELEHGVIDSVRVVGARGRVGSAVSARLRERGVRLDASDPALVLLCVPDRAIAEVAAGIATGPWVAHVSGATPLAALARHTRRFSVHPLQTFTHARGPEQLDGAFAAVTAEADDAHAVALELASLLGLRPFDLADDRRVLYHAGAVMAGNYLVTLRRAGGALLEAADAPPEALEPLMRRVIENDFALTGPIDRGDWETVDRHLAAIHAEQPEVEESYRALLRLTARQVGVTAGAEAHATRATVRVCRTVADLRAALAARRDGTVGLIPTMGALHAGHRALLDAAREACDTVVLSLFVNPSQFSDTADLDRYPRDEEADLRAAADAGVDLVFAPDAAELYPAGYQTWVDVTELGSILEGSHRPGHFRGVATVCLKLFAIARPDRAYFGQKDAQQVEVVRRMARDLHLETEIVVVPTVRDADGLALSSRNAGLSQVDRERARAIPAALATRDATAARRLLESAGLEVDYVELAPFDPPVLATAVRVGSTRLIDNTPLEEEP